MGACRRNRLFLWSVRASELEVSEYGEALVGWSFTLTLRHCPVSSDEWHRVRRRFEKRMCRAGCLRMHWVTEWQKRGVPHLHGCLWLPYDKGWPHQQRCIVDAWLASAEQLAPAMMSQHVAPVYDARGWFRYLAQHMARGVHHYQRCADNIPAGWQGRTGRMWGHIGRWPTDEPVGHWQSRSAFYRGRRLVRGWRKAEARARRQWRGVAAARRMLKGSGCRSGVRGVSGDLPEAAQAAVLEYLAGCQG